MIERAVARIDLGAIERNCAHIRAQLRNDAKLCAVVKADAYGHGDTWCAKAALAGGAEWLAVAAVSEALELRRHGIDAPLLIMGALTAEDEPLARLVEMRYFGGMTAEETAEALGLSVHVVRHDLRYAQAWLRQKLAP